MIVIYHKDNKVVEVVRNETKYIANTTIIADCLFNLAETHEHELLLWCHLDLKENLNFEKLADIFHHKKIMASYNLSTTSVLPETIGYIEESPFIKIKNDVSYPTWRMSSNVGGIHSATLMLIKDQIRGEKNFDYFLCSLAKLAMPKGLLCYSEPALVKNSSSKQDDIRQNDFILYRFVKQHYRTRWVFLLFLNFILYERKITFFPLISSFLYSKRTIKTDLFVNIEVDSTKRVADLGTFDVIIPTIGRKKYLYDVLKDLSKQTILPVNIIIVEQNPDPNSVSELDYLASENWPFTIKHTFTHQSGACNARNLGLAAVESEWIFLNDDDNRFEENLIQNVLQNLQKFGLKSLSTSYLQPKEIKLNSPVSQSPIFGSGNSFIHSSLLQKVKFDMRFEFGYGEDSDFGSQLRNQGVDVVYFPNPEILHLKAPIGGFRVKPVQEWDNDKIQPKPSPTIMLNKQLHLSKYQINCYRTILFFKFYKVQAVKNPVKYFKKFTAQWEQSLFWADKLKNKNLE